MIVPPGRQQAVTIEMESDLPSLDKVLNCTSYKSGPDLKQMSSIAVGSQLGFCF